MGKSKKRKRNKKKNKQNYSSNKTQRKPQKKKDNKEIPLKIKNFMTIIENKNEFQKISPIMIVDDGGYAYDVAEALKDDLNHTQLRNFYAHIKKIERKYDTWDEIKPELYLLKPRLASKYVQGYIPYGFYELMMLIIRKISSKSDFERFVQFFEATVAFHKYLGEIKDV